MPNEEGASEQPDRLPRRRERLNGERDGRRRQVLWERECWLLWLPFSRENEVLHHNNGSSLRTTLLSRQNAFIAYRMYRHFWVENERYTYS